MQRVESEASSVDDKVAAVEDISFYYAKISLLDFLFSADKKQETEKSIFEMKASLNVYLFPNECTTR